MNESEFESDPKVIDEYVRLHRTGEPDAMQQASEFFYRQLNRYVMKLANEHYPTFMQSQGEDLIQCAWIGILEAIDRYDPYSYAMTTHFKPYILEQMSLYINDAPSRHLCQNLTKLRAADSKSGESNVSKLSEKTGLPESSIRNALMHMNIRQTADLDEIGSFLMDENADGNPEQALLQEERINLLKEELCRRLNRPEYEYICDRFGLCSTFEGKTGDYRAGLERKIMFRLRSSAIMQQLNENYAN